MRLRIHHVTQYGYSVPLAYAVQALCLTPRSSAHQTVHQWGLKAPGKLFEQLDGWGNVTHTWTLERRLLAGSVEAFGEVEVHAAPRCIDTHLPTALFLRTTPLTHADEALAELGRSHLSKQVEASAVVALTDAVCARVRYQPGVTTVHTRAVEAWQRGAGVCQDQAHVFIAACRAAGVPARYVSGYFHALEAPDLASHAWVEVCVDPAVGEWVAVDVTHRCLIDHRHVRLAAGPDYAACPPVRGVREGGGEETMRVSVDIRTVSDALAGGGEGADTPPVIPSPHRD